MIAQSRRAFVAGSSLALAGRLARAVEPARRPRIKIGQIGVGHGHANKLAVFRRSPDYEVVGIVESDEKQRKTAESQPAFQGLPWMRQEQLLNVAGLQLVLVETRVRDLLTVAEACIAAGKHVHLDKPAGESLPHFRRILKAAGKQKLLVQMGYMYRYNPAIVLLRDTLARGWLGEPFEVVGVISKLVSPADRAMFAEYRGGMMFELGCHLIDLVVSVSGKPQRVIPFSKHTARIDDGLADNMLAVLEYPNATATVRATALEVEGFERRHLTVCGTEGTFHVQPLDDPAAKVALAAPHGDYRAGYQDVRFPKYERYIADAADIAAVLRGEKESEFGHQHDLAAQETVLRASGLGVE
jgi:predicted dehydrogenase